MFLNGVVIVLYCLLKMSDQDFPGGPVAKTPCYKSRGPIPGQRTKHPMPQLKIPTLLRIHKLQLKILCAQKRVMTVARKRGRRKEGKKEKERKGKEKEKKFINLDMWN